MGSRIIHNSRSRLFVEENVVDKLSSSLVVPLRCHMSNTFESEQGELLAKLPYAACVLLSVFKLNLPWFPVIYGGEFKFFSE